MIGQLFSLGSTLLQLGVLLLALMFGIRWAFRTERSLYLVFYAMAMCAYFCSDLYWAAHDLLRDGVRVPFAANDMADFGSFLLISSALNAAVERRRPPVGLTVAAVLFSAANVALWIAWSGEWVRDLFGGLAFGCFVCACAHSLHLTEALRRWEWWALALLCLALPLIEAASILYPASRVLLENLGYGLMYLAEAWFLFRQLRALCADTDPDKALSLCFSSFCWCSVAMYMSSDTPYLIHSNLLTLLFILMLLAVGKKVKHR